MPKTYFISDLHLSPDMPRVSAGFLALLGQIRGADALYVLGDLFESWVGDDHADEYNQRILVAFRALADSGTRLYFVHGNRDFLLGQAFAEATGGRLLPESQVVEAFGQKLLLMHGDQLCTGDEKYMAFRAQSRDPAWQATMLGNPLEQRLMIASMWRMQSKANNANKPENIMDVTPAEAERVLRESGARTLLHGHTHRPGIHELKVDGEAAQRLVLGDWREESGEAVIAVADEKGLRLETFRF